MRSKLITTIDAALTFLAMMMMIDSRRSILSKPPNKMIGDRPNGKIGLSLNAGKFCIIPLAQDRTFLACRIVLQSRRSLDV